MKILIIGSFPLDTKRIKGGVESSVYGLATALATQNEVLIADLPRQGIKDGCEKCGTILVHRFANQGHRNINGVKRANDISQWVASHKPDVCHLHGTSITVYKIFQALKRKGLTSVLTVHGLAHIEKKKNLKAKLSAKALFQYIYQRHYELKLIEASPCVIADTPYVAKSIRTALPHRESTDFHIIPQGIDIKYLTNQCDSESPMILAVGSYSPRKGHLQLLEIFNLLAEKHPELRLTIAGSATDSPYLHKVQAYLENKRWGDRINLLTNVDSNILHQLYSQAHIFVLHSFEESQGIVFLEAMAAGLPIVATRVGGIPDVVSEGENGILCSLNHPEEFADAIELLMEDKQQWMNISTLNKKKAREYSWSAIAERVEHLYKTTIHT